MQKKWILEKNIKILLYEYAVITTNKIVLLMGGIMMLDNMW